MNSLLAVLGVLALTGLGPVPTPASGPPDPGPAVRPLQPGQLVAGFEPPDVTWGAGHRGVDLLGSPGAPVRSALSGTVSFAGVIAGRGVVVVSHGARRTTYEPVAAWVRAGDGVEGGQQIGVLEPGASHCAPRACLHWGLREGDQYLDPLTLLGAAPVRLLPLTPSDEPAGRRSAGVRW